MIQIDFFDTKFSHIFSSYPLPSSFWKIELIKKQNSKKILFLQISIRILYNLEILMDFQKILIRS